MIRLLHITFYYYFMTYIRCTTLALTLDTTLYQLVLYIISASSNVFFLYGMDYGSKCVESAGVALYMHMSHGQLFNFVQLHARHFARTRKIPRNQLVAHHMQLLHNKGSGEHTER